jgi:hypothetical protein
MDKLDPHKSLILTGNLAENWIRQKGRKSSSNGVATRGWL